ncbi:MAG: AsmA-like C-terminal region-containing protein [Micavibrio sp.]|nr:AsmA-like C-terminal region-containing protein [Micavibrio sp.]
MAARKKSFLRRFVIFLLVVGALGYAASRLVTLNMLKPRLEAAATEATGLPAKINGNIHAGMMHGHPAVFLGEMQLGQKGKGSFYEVEKVSVALPYYKPGDGKPWPFYLKVDNLRIDGIGYGDYKTPVDFYYPDGVEMPKLEGTLKQASLHGNASVRNNRLKADIKIEGLDYAQFAKGIKGGNATLDVTATADVRRLMQTMAGHTLLVGGKGSMEGDTLNFWAGDLLSSILSGAQKETEVNCSVAEFVTTDGIARSKTILFDTPRVTVLGKGNVDLVRERVDMTFTPKPKSSTLLSLATPVDVSGPFNNISAQPSAIGIVTKLGGLVMGAIAAPTALLSLSEKGANGNPCLHYLQKKEGK